MVYMRRSPGGSCSGAAWTVECLGAEEAWASSGYSILTLCVSDGVGLDRPP
jgi:hypothetical protein